MDGLNPIEREEFFLEKIGGQEVTPPDAVTRIEHYLQDIIDGNASTIPPITRIEYYLAKISGADVDVPDPATRTEYYLAKIAGMDVEPPDPITRLDYFLAQWVETGGGVLETVTGTAPITLTNAIAKAMVSLTQYGLCTQADTPTPSAPVDIVCNNGTLKMVDDELPAGYNRVLGFSMKNNAYWEIPNFPMNGSDTLRFSFEATDACNVIGAYSGSASGNNYSLYVSQTSNYLRYKNGAYNSTVDFDTRYDVEITPTGSSGMKVDSTWTAQTFTTPTNFCIGTTSVSASSAKLKGNLYGNIEVVGRAKFIPCERISDNVLGYYDLIGETFYMPTSGTPTSLGYDGSHYHLAAVGTPEVLTVTDEDSNTQTASVVNLFGVGDYADTQDIISGAVERKVGIKVFDGTENWARTSSGSGFTVFSVETNAHSIQGWSEIKSLCTNFECYVGDVSPTYIAGNAGKFWLNTSGQYFRFVTDGTMDLAQFKAFLAAQYAAGTPVIVIYPLAEEITEQVTAQSLSTAAGTNVVNVTAEVSPIELEAEYMAVAP